MPVNMVKAEMNTSGGLDTTFVAKNVRELLAVHNIGQRLFAKHVLGLSQGTVSELLSKPKSWDKLTEKGRESYRKMHAWATDDANILALKAMSPKKSESPVFLVNVFSAFLFFIFNSFYCEISVCTHCNISCDFAVYSNDIQEQGSMHNDCNYGQYVPNHMCNFSEKSSP